MKKFRKKKAPIKMNTMKKIDCKGLANSFGPLSRLVTSIDEYIISGQPSRDATIKSVIIDSPMLSKLELKRSHSPPWS